VAALWPPRRSPRRAQRPITAAADRRQCDWRVERPTAATSTPLTRCPSKPEGFVRPAAVTVANAQALEESRRLAALLTRALESRTVTDYAIGIIMSRTGATPDQALAQLRQLSQTTSTKLTVIAAQLVHQAVGKARHRHTPNHRPTGGDHA
jgi:AmiR/NasT family two-component response regulator